MGWNPVNSNPAVSSNPSATLAAWTAWPAEPFIMLSMAENTTTRLFRGSSSNPTSAKFDPATAFG